MERLEEELPLVVADSNRHTGRRDDATAGVVRYPCIYIACAVLLAGVALLSASVLAVLYLSLYAAHSRFDGIAGGAADAPRLSAREIGFFFYVHSEPRFVVREQLAMIRLAYSFDSAASATPAALPPVYISSDHGPVDYRSVCDEYVALGGRCHYVYQPEQLGFDSGRCGKKCLAPGAPSSAVFDGPPHHRMFCDMWTARLDEAVAFLGTPWTVMVEGDVSILNAPRRPPPSTDFASCGNFDIKWPPALIALIEQRSGRALHWPGFCAMGGFMVRSAAYVTARRMIAAHATEWADFKDAASDAPMHADEAGRRDFNAIDVTDTCISGTMLFGNARGGPSFDFLELMSPFNPHYRSGSEFTSDADPIAVGRAAQMGGVWANAKRGAAKFRAFPYGLDASLCYDCLRSCRAAHCSPIAADELARGVAANRPARFDVVAAARESAAASTCIAQRSVAQCLRARCPAFIHHTKGGLCSRYAAQHGHLDSSFALCDERDALTWQTVLSPFTQWHGSIMECLFLGVCTNGCTSNLRGKAAMLHAALLLSAIGVGGALLAVQWRRTHFARSVVARATTTTK
jgi:hypothetical protein